MKQLLKQEPNVNVKISRNENWRFRSKRNCAQTNNGNPNKVYIFWKFIK